MKCFMTGKTCSLWHDHDNAEPLIKRIEDFNIEWNEVKKQYAIVASFKEDLRILHEMVAQVAENSKCSCGNPLRLADHTIRSTEGGYTFAGIYRCPICKEPKPTALQKIRDFFRKLQVEGKVLGVKVGYNGLATSNGHNNADSGDD